MVPHSKTSSQYTTTCAWGKLSVSAIMPPMLDIKELFQDKSAPPVNTGSLWRPSSIIWIPSTLCCSTPYHPVMVPSLALVYFVQGYCLAFSCHTLWETTLSLDFIHMFQTDMVPHQRLSLIPQVCSFCSAAGGIMCPPHQGCQVQQFLKPKLVQLVGPTFITVGPTIADCGYFP